MEKPICVLGLDISSSKIGIAVLDENKNILTSEVLKLSSDLSLEERGLMLENKLIKLNKHYYIDDVASMLKSKIRCPVMSSSDNTLKLMSKFTVFSL